MSYTVPNIGQHLVNESTIGNWFIERTSYTFVLDQQIFFGLILTVLLCLLITRNVKQWAWLSFPITVLLALAGVKMHQLQYVITAIIFTINIVSIETITNTLRVVVRKSRDATEEALKYAQQEARRIERRTERETYKEKKAEEKKKEKEQKAEKKRIEDIRKANTPLTMTNVLNYDFTKPTARTKSTQPQIIGLQGKDTSGVIKKLEPLTSLENKREKKRKETQQLNKRTKEILKGLNSPNYGKYLDIGTMITQQSKNERKRKRKQYR